MHRGLQIDPESYQSFHEVELKRKLWATILEMRSSMDSGGLLLVNTHDSDDKPPLNADDAVLLDENLDDLLHPVKPTDQFTQASLQIMLLDSVELRLEIATFINAFRTDAASSKRAI